MPEVIFNDVARVNYLSNPWIDRDNDFLYESDVSDIICLTSESKRFRYQIGYEVSPEVSKVDESVPSTRASEPAKTLESDLLISYGGLRCVESVCDFVWSPAKGTDISARRIQFPAMQDRGTEEWPVTLEFEGIANDACIEFCNTHGLISDLRKCLNQAETIFLNRQSLSAEYDRFDKDEYEEDGHVVIRIQVNSDQETAFKEYDAFTDWMLDNISDDNLDSFVVTVSPV